MQYFEYIYFLKNVCLPFYQEDPMCVNLFLNVKTSNEKQD